VAEGHRERVRTRANEQDTDTIPDYEVLEMIMHGVVKRQDVGAAARALIAEFGSLANVIDAPVHKLCKIDGVGRVAADFIKKVPYFYNKYMQSKNSDVRTFSDVSDVMEYLKLRFAGKQTESFVVMCLNSKLRLLDCKTIFEGNVASVMINLREIMDYVITHKATRVFIAHNHPDGDPTPSDEDKTITKLVYNALSITGANLEDHFVVTDNECTSIKSLGNYPSLPGRK